MVFEANPRRYTNVVELGSDRSPLIVIDDFSIDPAGLVDLAAQATYIEVGPIYPGVRAPAPEGYEVALLAAVASRMQEVFGARPELELELCAFSMVTTPAGSLKPLQRIPHFDGPETSRFAFVHYLCAPEFGGTSFYRHRATGFECMTPDRVLVYREHLREQLNASVPAAGYVDGDNEYFERIHSVAARFNRLIIYRGNALHSGDIPAEVLLTENPRAGRLTINSFGHLRAT
jgi:hypothetical protein